jgi:hypothetical protein
MSAKRTSGAKALIRVARFGTAEAVPFVEICLFPYRLERLAAGSTQQ